MKKHTGIFLTILCLLIFAGFAVQAQTTESSPEGTPSPTSTDATPLPPLMEVPEDNLIIPKKGLGKVEFNMNIQQVEDLLGRGILQPKETDFFGNSIVNLAYKDKGVSFSFLNGQMANINIYNPEYATKGGVRVMGDIGDAFRELGFDFRQEKSIVQDPDPSKQEYDIFYDQKNIAFKCKGRIIQEITLKSHLKMNFKKKK